MLREAWFLTWELQGAAAGMDEVWIQREREKDEIALPLEDVGLYVRHNVVWAVKEGALSE